MNQNEATQQLMTSAMRLHSSGDFVQADALYQQALAKDPRNAVALHWRGVIALQTGQLEAAARHIKAALQLSPDYIEACINLGNVYQAQGDLQQAISCFQRALLSEPGAAALHANLGNAYLQSEAYFPAIESYQAALAINPGLAEPRRNLAMSLLRTGNTAEAMRAIEEAARRNPGSVEIGFSRGIILQEAGRTQEAIELFEALQAHLPDSAPVLNNLGSVLKKNGRSDLARDYFERAVVIDPAFADAHLNLGVLYKEQGERDRAEISVRTAIKHDPGAGKAHHLLSGLIKHVSFDTDMQTMLSLTGDEHGNPLDQAYLNFGLGKAYEDLQNYDAAFACFAKANSLYRSTYSYNIDEDEPVFQNIQALFTPQFVERIQNRQPEASTPIFIIGMPRSGTTLVEQILDSHPDVHGGGELRFFSECLAAHCTLDDGVDYSRGLQSLTSDRLQNIGDCYLHRLRALAPDSARIVDKLPMNFFNVGVIRAVLPNARIIHCRRNAVDTCLSIFKNMLPERGHTYAYDLAELALFYRHYRNLMEHWDRLYPQALIHIDYERLVADQEHQTRRLIEACELPWDDRCMSFYKNRRSVRTISAEQVRRPLYSSSVNLSRHYGKHLESLVEILNS